VNGSGTASGGGRFDIGTQCTLTATPTGHGIVFLGWMKTSSQEWISGMKLYDRNPYSFAVFNNQEWTAFFGYPDERSQYIYVTDE